eukprot:3335630-Rhodomonas_salina.1
MQLQPCPSAPDTPPSPTRNKDTASARSSGAQLTWGWGVVLGPGREVRVQKQRGWRGYCSTQ